MQVFERQYRELGFTAQRRYPNEELLRFVGRRYGRLGPSERRALRILDLGCGSGSNLWMLAREGFEAHGVDAAPAGLELCRQMLASWGVEASLQVADFRELPYADASFDAVVDVVSLQHLDLAGHAAALAEVARILRPGGRFFSFHLGAGSFSFLNGGGRLLDRCTIHDIVNDRAPLAHNGPTCFLDAATALELLGRAGLGETTVEKVIKTYEQTAIAIEYLVLDAKKPG
jgi:SAM-dependent methyltransferase